MTDAAALEKLKPDARISVQSFAMYTYLAVTVVSFVLIKCLQVAYNYWKMVQVSKKIPCHPLNHPIWGLAHLVRDLESYLDLLTPYVQQSGVRLTQAWNLFFFPVYGAVHPDTVQQVLKCSHPKNRGLGGPFRLIMPWIGDGLLVSGGIKWERNRRLLTPAFHYDILKPYVMEYNDVATILLEQIAKDMSASRRINICPLISRATLDAILRCTLSYYDRVQEEREANQYIRSVHRLTELLDKRVFNPLKHLDFLYYMSAEGKEFRRLCHFVHGFSSDIIIKRKKQLDSDPSKLRAKHRLDFLDVLLTAKDENGDKLSHQEVRDEVDTFLFEGHDTVSSAMMWTLYCLAKYPEEQTKVRTEINEILDGRQMLEYDDIPKLRQLSCFLKESMRVYSPVPALSQVSVKECVVDGVTFPPGSKFDIYQHVLNHNPKVWPDYDVFRPDRFSEDNFATRHPFTFIPFSGGSRNCIGQVFAKNELKIVISRIITRFCIAVDKNKIPVPYPSIVTRAKDGIFLSFFDL